MKKFFGDKNKSLMVYTDKHLNMLLPEFLEALCRAIDKASPIPPGENKEEWPLSRRQEQPLVNKLENVLPALIKLINHPDFKNLREKFPMPLKDLATGLYVPNYQNPFYQGYIIKPGIRKNEKTRSFINARSRSSFTSNESTNKSIEQLFIKDTISSQGDSVDDIKKNNFEDNEIKVEINNTIEEDKGIKIIENIGNTEGSTQNEI